MSVAVCWPGTGRQPLPSLHSNRSATTRGALVSAPGSEAATSIVGWAPGEIGPLGAPPALTRMSTPCTG